MHHHQTSQRPTRKSRTLEATPGKVASAATLPSGGFTHCGDHTPSSYTIYRYSYVLDLDKMNEYYCRWSVLCVPICYFFPISVVICIPSDMLLRICFSVITQLYCV